MCDTNFFFLHQLRVLESRILSQIFGTKMDENGEWRRLYNEDFPNLYYWSNIIRELSLEDCGHATRMRKSSRNLKSLTGNTRKRPLDGRIIISIDLKEIGISKKQWIDLIQDRYYWRDLVNSTWNLWIPQVMMLVNLQLPNVQLSSWIVEKKSWRVVHFVVV